MKATAKDLRNLVRAGVEGAIETVRGLHPRMGSLSAGSAEAQGFKLADAQLTLARHHGFASWPKLATCVEEMRRWSRSPHARLGDGTARDGDELIRLACMNFGEDSADRPAAALDLWRSDRSVAESSIFVAAAVGDHVCVARFVGEDRGAATRAGGPFDWPPVLYATYSRLATGDPNHDFVETVRVLLRFGADPNSGFLWEGLVPPFTAITGAIGRGEQGCGPHVDQLALMGLLLDAGADPNDSQAIYNAGIGNAQPRDDVDWLEMLLAHGFGRASDGPWFRRFPDRLPRPDVMVAELLHDAVRRGLTNRARLLLAHGADPNRAGDHPVFRGASPYEDAMTRGYPDIADLLVHAGALRVEVSAIDQILGRCLAGELVAAADVAVARDHTPDLVRMACDLAKPVTVIHRLVELGWGVNVKNGCTALHEAAMHGSLETVQVLLALGADPTIADDRFHANPAGWAAHFGHADVQHYLDNLL